MTWLLAREALADHLRTFEPSAADEPAVRFATADEAMAWFEGSAAL